MHYGTLKMSKAPPFTESSCWAIFLLKSLPMCINMWVKVKEMILITALCVYGPLSKLVDLAQFGSFWSLFLHFFGPIRGWMAQNQVQWDRVLLYCSGGGLWGPCWDILGHFRVILGLRARGWGLFGAYFSPVWLPKRTWMAQNQVLCGRILTYCTGGGLLGPFGGHFR